MFVGVLGCAGAPVTRTGPVTADRGPPTSVARPAAEPRSPAATAISSLIELARAGELKALDERVDWSFVHRLSSESTLSDLAATLTSLPSCRVDFRDDEGGSHLGLGDEELRAELREGTDVTVLCMFESEDLYDDGHSELIEIPEERFTLNVHREDSGAHRVRGYRRWK